VVGWRTDVRWPRDRYVRLEGNDYSVHPAVIGRRVLVSAGLAPRCTRHSQGWLRTGPDRGVDPRGVPDRLPTARGVRPEAHGGDGRIRAAAPGLKLVGGLRFRSCTVPRT